MNLDTLQISVRPRRDWEAVDLGVQMARQWWWPLQRIWLLFTLPWLIVGLLLPSPWPSWLLLVLWWLKPIYERPLLFYLSQSVFGVEPSVRQTLRVLPRLCVRQTLQSLTWRRLSPSRSMDLPVAQLEGLGGISRSTRLAVLHRDDAAPAKWLTIIGAHIEFFISLSVLVLIGALIPAEVNFDYFSLEFWADSRGAIVIPVITGYLAMAIVAPFYVACGFALYLNRRIKLEAWDIEIGFRRMLQTRGLTAPAVILCLCLLGGLSLPQPLQAETPVASNAIEAQQIKEQVYEIQQSAELRRIVERSVIKPRETEKTDAAWLRRLFDALIKFGNWISLAAGVAELLLWAALVLALAWIAWRFPVWRRWFDAALPRRRRAFQPQTLFGLEVSEESLPKDVAGEALRLWQLQQTRQSLSLLYRACLTRLLAQGLPIDAASTERECLQLAKTSVQAGLSAEQVDYFTQLTHLWRNLAYGHISPPAQQVHQLCEHWPQTWRNAP